MSREQQKASSWIGYAIYAVTLTTILLYIRFPADTVEQYLEARIARELPTLIVDLEDVRPGLPVGLRIGRIEIMPVGPGEPLLTVQQCRVRAAIIPLLRRKPAMSIKGAAYGGHFFGTVLLPEGEAGPLRADLEITDIDLSQYGSAKTLFGRAVTGLLNGTITFANDRGGLLTGNGAMDLRLNSGSLELAQPLLGLEAIDLEDVRLAAILKKGVVQLTGLDMVGQQARSTVTGTIRLQRPLRNSRVALKGTVEPAADFLEQNAGIVKALGILKGKMKQGRIGFGVNGSIGNPRWKIL